MTIKEAELVKEALLTYKRPDNANVWGSGPLDTSNAKIIIAKIKEFPPEDRDRLIKEFG